MGGRGGLSRGPARRHSSREGDSGRPQGLRLAVGEGQALGSRDSLRREALSSETEASGGWLSARPPSPGRPPDSRGAGSQPRSVAQPPAALTLPDPAPHGSFSLCPSASSSVGIDGPGTGRREGSGALRVSSSSSATAAPSHPHPSPAVLSAPLRGLRTLAVNKSPQVSQQVRSGEELNSLFNYLC